PWSSYRGAAGSWAIYRQGAVASWENLKEYALMYRNPNMTTSSSGTSRIKTNSVAIDGDAYNFIHRVRILPVIARIQWVFSYSAKSAASGTVTPGILVNPVITMWNPYNVEITMPQASGSSPTVTLSVGKPLPVALKFDINGAPGGAYRPLFGASTNYAGTPSYSDAQTLTYRIMGPLTLKPGETRVFSGDPSGASGSNPPPAAALDLKTGYRAAGGHFFPIVGTEKQPGTVPAGSMVKCDAKFNVAYDDLSKGVGIYLDMSIDGTNRLAYRMTYSEAMAGAVYQDLPGLASASLSNAISTPTPFLSTIFGARTASRTLIPTKGFVQSSPLVNYTAMGGKDRVETTIGKHYFGTNHPANSPFDYSFVEHSSGGDDYLPNVNESSQSGYIVSGFNKAKGLSRCVIAEIPTRPLQSLCELQNWDMRYENPIPPYAFNLIGNSDATPLVSSNVVVETTNASNAQNLQHDDSYCANHIFFDDWFFSSISPDPDSFGANGRDVKTTFADFLSGKKSLGNNAYKPIAADTGLDSGAAGQVYADHVKTSDGWKTIASRLEVEGMFNVNSTSVTAWTALLGHARNQCVPFYQSQGTSWSVGVSGKTDHPISRFAVSGDVQAGESGSSGSFPGASEFTGYRVLDDALIARLAQEVVKQVRQRGPFLSLSEFVNRQLSTGDLAIAGTVQAALNEIAKGGGSNPYAYLQTASLDATSNLKLASEAEYKYPEAANGKSSFGFPGWTRQADVLRPLAPILSARDDTFVIRTHGDARDDNGKIISSATCEAVVQRTRDYVDSKDASDLATPPTSDINKTFGRRFEVVSFRWLLSEEI
ncbi:MAG: hypothetical protein JWO82_3987, partial [Akkermansiaceae bacterium]|nr:hypothetical protein [Akkermansiaceae bacterium]